MKKSKIKGKSTKLPTPFEITVHKTERTAASILMHWMRQIIEEENLNLGMPDALDEANHRRGKSKFGNA